MIWIFRSDGIVNVKSMQNQAQPEIFNLKRCVNHGRTPTKKTQINKSIKYFRRFLFPLKKPISSTQKKFLNTTNAMYR